MRVFRHKLVLFICSFPGFCYFRIMRCTFYAASLLFPWCSPRKTKCLLCNLWHHTTFRSVHSAAAEFNAALCTGFLKPPQSDIRCLSVCLCVCVSVCLSMYPFISPKTSLFSTRLPETSHRSRVGLRWNFCAGFFFEPVTRNVGNEPLESSQTLHKDRINFLAFWIPNSTKNSPSLEAYHLSCSKENYPHIMEPEISIICV
jgi:hypothetical protein